MNNCNKPPVNMRRALRMMDGGEIHADMGGMWESLKRTATGRPAETLSEQYARKDAARAASRPAPAPVAAPAAAPPAQTAAPMGSQSVLDRRMAAAGLRDGGDLRTGHGGVVPGTGTGDKIPAKYEPGEFVVSNDMLDAQPELRGHLRSLRESVLAEKGMTPEQADAKALDGTGLRAMDGQTPLLPYDKSVGARAAEATTQAEYAAKQVADAKLRAEALTQQARVAPPNSGPANAPTGYRAGQAAAKGVKLLGKAAPYVGAAIEAGDVVDVARDPNSSKIDVATQTAEGVSKLAGAAAGGMAGAAVGGPFAPVTGLAGGIAGYYAPEAATKALRWATGQDTASPVDRVRIRGSAVTAAPKLRAPDAADMPAISGSFGGTNSASPAPSPAPSLRTQSFAAGTPEAIAAGKQMDSGSKYIPGYGKGMIRNSRGDIIQLDTSGDAPSSGRVETRLAPSSYRSLSESPSAPSLLNARPQAASFIEEVRNNAQRRAGERARSLDIQSDANVMNNRATLRGQDVAVRGQDIAARGQDLNYGSSIYGHDLSAKTARAQALRDQYNKDRDYTRGVSNDAFAQRGEADKNLTSKLESIFTTRDDKGNTVPDRDLIASHKAGITSYIGNTIAGLEKVPPTSPEYAQFQRAAAALREKGAAGLGEDRLQKLIAQLEVQRRSADASSGFNPLKGRHVDSSNPEDYAITGVEPGVLQDQYILKGGGRVPTRVLDYDKGGNAILPNFMWNSPTRRFDIIKQKGLRDE